MSDPSNELWSVYLSGEIHTDWRERIVGAARERGLPLRFSSAITNHAASDAAGDALAHPATVGPDGTTPGFWRDHRSASVNAMRTVTQIRACDIAVIRFGSEYKQWNAAFDAGQCAALGKPYITLHDEAIVHPLKEVDAQAMAWATTPEQVVELLDYVTGDAAAPRFG